LSRLQKILSAHGIASRREAERMIADGRVEINGVKATVGQSAIPGQDRITVDSIELKHADKKIYLMLNKPEGYLTTVTDDRSRQTVMELVSGAEARVYPVGRLDLNSEGLLLFTNDGEFANRIMHPSFNINKAYEVKVRGDVQEAVRLLQMPVCIDEHTVRVVNVEIIEKTTSGGRITITISEGRNRQVRKMCIACGLKVDKLKRISIGELMLGDLKTGKWRHLTEDEVLLLSSEKSDVLSP